MSEARPVLGLCTQCVIVFVLCLVFNLSGVRKKQPEASLFLSKIVQSAKVLLVVKKVQRACLKVEAKKPKKRHNDGFYLKKNF